MAIYEKKVSVIVTVYNIEKYISRCIESIINQTYNKMEILLVDDGSKDSSGTICDLYAKKDKRIRVIHKVNGGISSARNAALNVASGDYILFVDGDDWVHTEILSTVVPLIDKYNADIVSFDYCIVDQTVNERKITCNIKGVFSSDKINYYISHLFKADSLEQPLWNKLYKRELFQNISFPESQLYEDMYTNLQILENCGTFVKCDAIGYYYNHEGTSITRSSFKKNNLDLLKVCEQITREIKKYDDERLINLCYALTAKSEVSILIRLASGPKGDNKEVIKDLRNRIRSEKKYLKYGPKLNKEIILAKIVSCNWYLFKLIIRLGYGFYKKAKVNS